MAPPEDLVAALDLSRDKFDPILKMVSERTGVSVADILGKGRRAPIAAARQEAMWTVRTITNWSLSRIGGRFNRDHTTVLHAIRQVEARADQDADLRAFMDAVKNAFC
ncbi:helix-turn-helix domain-containing protein [Rhodoblastus acidophilus]|nr:helix-turn-helix domain-containing protein [Rhodoblastus acidophilus]